MPNAVFSLFLMTSVFPEVNQQTQKEKPEIKQGG